MSQRSYLDHNATSPLRPEAAEAMARAFQLPGNPSSVHAEGRAARAARTLERAVSLDAARPSSHLHLAIAYVQIDRPDDALAAAQRALALRPDYPQARALIEALGRAGIR